VADFGKYDKEKERNFLPERIAGKSYEVGIKARARYAKCGSIIVTISLPSLPNVDFEDSSCKGGRMRIVCEEGFIKMLKY
jgi:hypothetical protein